MIVTKYPAVVIRNKEPAWTWEMERSASMAGSRGAMTILPMKLRKKMEARRRIGLIWERKDVLFSPGVIVESFNRMKLFSIQIGAPHLSEQAQKNK
jgi:hypothetical protein